MLVRGSTSRSNHQHGHYTDILKYEMQDLRTLPSPMNATLTTHASLTGCPGSEIRRLALKAEVASSPYASLRPFRGGSSSTLPYMGLGFQVWGLAMSPHRLSLCRLIDEST